MLSKPWAVKLYLLITFLSIWLWAEPPTVNTTENVTAPAQESSLSFYDKAMLNDPIMQIDMDQLQTGLEQHVYKVREGSIGGYDSAGGACGCN